MGVYVYVLPSPAQAEGHCGDNSLGGVASSRRQPENRSFSNADGL